ncbi:MAG: indole-3-glycerol-phosphate synthase [Kiritimatiellia bacterium]
MENMLQQMMRERQADALRAQSSLPLADLQRQVSGMEGRRSLMDRLRQANAGTPCILAEIKRASPSAGVLDDDCDPALKAREYEANGACCVSVVTEPRHFNGRDADMTAARAAVSLPVLRKDFFSEPYQIYESAALGADVVLLIAAMLDFNRLRDLYIVALALGLEVLVEVHTAEELEMVLPLANIIVGVNSRNLETMKTDLTVARELVSLIPADRLAIAESGIRSRRDVQDLQKLGYRGFLIGEVLMHSAQPGVLLRMLLGRH